MKFVLFSSRFTSLFLQQKLYLTQVFVKTFSKRTSFIIWTYVKLEHTLRTTSSIAPLSVLAISRAFLSTWLPQKEQRENFGANCCLVINTATLASIKEIRVRIIFSLRWANFHKNSADVTSLSNSRMAFGFPKMLVDLILPFKRHIYLFRLAKQKELVFQSSVSIIKSCGDISTFTWISEAVKLVPTDRESHWNQPPGAPKFCMERLMWNLGVTDVLMYLDVKKFIYSFRCGIIFSEFAGSWTTSWTAKAIS